MSFHCCLVEAKEHLPQLTGSVLPNAAQVLLDTFTLKTHSHLVVCQGFQFLFCRTSFQLVGLQNILVYGVNHPQGQDCIFFSVELHEVPLCTFLKLLQDPLNGRTSIWLMSHTSQILSSATMLRLHSVLSSNHS